MQNNELRYECRRGGIEITGYVGYPEVLRIPAEIDGEKVLGIGERAFARCLTLKELLVDEGIEYISPYAFFECVSLADIELPASIRKIGRKAFEKTAYFDRHPRVNGKLYVSAHVIDYNGVLPRVAINGCIGIADEAFIGVDRPIDVVFFDGLKYVGDRAFQGAGIKEAIMPEGLEYIGDRAFAFTSNLERAGLKSGLKKIGYDPFFGSALSRKGDAFYIDNYLISVIGNGKFKLKKGVEGIANGAFAGANIESATLNGVTSIPEGCFYECQLLKKVIAPSVNNVGDDAFARCDLLESVTFAENCVYGVDCFYGVKSSSLPDTEKEDKASEVYLAKRLVSTNDIYGEYKVREGTLEVYPKAFARNTKIVKIYLPDSVEIVGRAAFSGCKNLTSLKLPKYLKTIERELCRGDEKLVDLEEPEKVEKISSAAFESANIGRFSFENVKEIADQAFLNCSRLSVAEHFENVEKIGERAFERSGLTEIKTDCSSIGKSAFAHSRSLRSVKIGVANFPENAFFACTSLKTVKSTVKDITIAKNAFAYCGSLSQIDLQNASLATSAFEKCIKLTSVTLSRSIPPKAFKNCTSLKEVVLTDGAMSIGVEAFAGCSSLETLIIPSTTETIGEKAFCETRIKELTLPSSVDVKSGAFANCKALVEIKSVGNYERSGELGERAFEGCSSLEKADLPAFHSIGNRAFAECGKLYEIRLKEGLRAIGAEAFSGDESLKKLTIPRSANKFGRNFIKDVAVEKENFLDALKKERGALLKFGGCSVKYKNGNLLTVPPFSEECYDDESWALKDIAAYDAFFGTYLEDKELKEPYVKSRLMFPVGLNEKNKAAFLREYFPALAQKAVEERNLKDISLYAENGCFTLDNINPVIEAASRRQAVEITALLLSVLKKLK